ncbi:hypothetical protein MYX76_18810, partial [Desulfobacterota bacterium AH_259_B03_O07]|nr:hypothetical protein [Desulfobacterota bacterium AH_259_B03_O07]
RNGAGSVSNRRGRNRQITACTGDERPSVTGATCEDREPLLTLLPEYSPISSDRSSAASA